VNENEELNYRMVYIVTAGNYVYGEEGDYGTAFRVVDVCSSLELAEMVAAVTTSVNPIVKLGVDCSNTLAFLQAKQYPFHVQMERGGEFYCCPIDAQSVDGRMVSRMSEARWPPNTGPKYSWLVLHGNIWARDEAQAKELIDAERRKRIANQQWPPDPMVRLIS